jgi:hypothetical protein
MAAYGPPLARLGAFAGLPLFVGGMMITVITSVHPAMARPAPAQPLFEALPVQLDGTGARSPGRPFEDSIDLAGRHALVPEHMRRPGERRHRHRKAPSIRPGRADPSVAPDRARVDRLIEDQSSVGSRRSAR